MPACTNTSAKARSSNNFNTTATLPNLTGLWVLNKELSQSPQDHKRNRKNNRDGQNTNSRGNGQHSGNGSGNGKGNKRGGSNSNYKQNNTKQRYLPPSFQALLNSLETLTIKHKDPLLIITSLDGQESIYTDFRSTQVSSNEDPNQKITIAGWEDNNLIVESTLSSGRFIQQFNLDDSTGKLSVMTEILSPQLPKPVKFNRVYDLVSAEIQ